MTENEAAEALDRAWAALDRAPNGTAEKAGLVRLLKQRPDLARQERRDDLLRLVRDRNVEPSAVARAGWSVVWSEAARPEDGAELAGWIEENPLALALLEETYVSTLEVEQALTGLRRWLLLNRCEEDHPRLAAALTAQACHNGGAWLVDAEEEAALRSEPSHPLGPAYFPPRPAPARPADFGDAVTDRVAEQYIGWPFPVWSRITTPVRTTLPKLLEEMDPGGRPLLPEGAEVLVAGCGTGRESALIGARFPDARVTAIDISSTSLAYAAERCRAPNVSFRLLDLHRAAELGTRFDFITSSGVLHHLPAPEMGWSRLVEVLKPGGVMRVMLYSRLGRMRLRAARTHLADLVGHPVNDDLLREARSRLIEKAPGLVSGHLDFYTMGGVHDLLLHSQEDPFDVPRIGRALGALGLSLLGFRLPAAQQEAYLSENPDDPLFRNLESIARFERRRPFLFSAMYEFWCRKSGA